MYPAPAEGSTGQLLGQAVSDGRAEFVLSGPAGAGKSTVARRVASVDSRTALNVSSTTRPKRPSESPNANHYFLREAEFERLVERGEMLEWAEVHGHCYGTRVSDVLSIFSQGRDALLKIDVQGGIAVRSMYNRTVLIFVVAPSFPETRERLAKRGSEAAEQVAKRIRRAKDETQESSSYDYLVVNDDVDSAISCIQSIITAERARMTEGRYRALVDETETSNQIAKGDESND